MEENKVEVIETNEVVDTEDVKEGLQLQDYAVIGAIGGAAILVWEGGRWVWKKTETPRKAVAGKMKGLWPFGKKDKVQKAEEEPEHEVASKKDGKKAEAKKSDKSDEK